MGRTSPATSKSREAEPDTTRVDAAPGGHGDEVPAGLHRAQISRRGRRRSTARAGSRWREPGWTGTPRRGHTREPRAELGVAHNIRLGQGVNGHYKAPRGA
jgi:hypothetical protein